MGSIVLFSIFDLHTMLLSSPLLLKNVTRYSSGTVKSGYVVNGNWRLEIGEVCKAIDEAGKTRNSWDPPALLLEVAVVESYLADYNRIIDKAYRDVKKSAAYKPSF